LRFDDQARRVYDVSDKREISLQEMQLMPDGRIYVQIYNGTASGDPVRKTEYYNAFNLPSYSTDSMPAKK